MNNTLVNTKKEFKSSIRQVNLNGKTAGGENGLPFMHSEIKNELKPLVAIEILTNIPANYSDILKNVWGDVINNPVEWAKAAQKKDADILAIRFNIDDNGNLDAKITQSQEQLKQILEITNIPVIILGTDKREADAKLLPALAKAAQKPCTVGMVLEENYKEIIPSVIEAGHNVIARTPIDINLAKQLNILITEMGFDPDRLIIDPNIGGLGYGLDYAYSIIERIKLAALEGDNMLNMPIITFVGEETWKTKEAKSVEAPSEWGNIKTRGIAWEALTASSLLSAGANIVVMYHPEAISKVKTFINKAVPQDG